MSAEQKMYWDSGFEYGKRAENDRLIKLLEDNAHGEYRRLMLTPQLMASLKGENK